MFSLDNSLWFVALFSGTVMLLGWFWQQQKTNAGIVDVLWAFCLSIAAIYYGITGTGELSVKILVALMAGAWYLRLSTHLYLRVMKEAEDGRYQAIRRYFGERTHAFHFFFFQFQALLVWGLSLPMWIAANNSKPNSVLLGVAVVIVAISFIGESLADKQLADFRNNPQNRGKTCRYGLWRYSRHPNYFFEWLHWFAYPLLAWGAPLAAWTWLAPVVMFLFVYYITGIPYTEQQAIRSRGQDYLDYQQTTRVFIPWKSTQRGVK